MAKISFTGVTSKDCPLDDVFTKQKQKVSSLVALEKAFSSLDFFFKNHTSYFIYYVFLVELFLFPCISSTQIKAQFPKIHRWL